MNARYYVVMRGYGYLACPEIMRAHPRQWPFTMMRDDAEAFATRAAAIERKKFAARQGHRELSVEKVQP